MTATGTKLSDLFDGPLMLDRLGESIPGLVYVYDLLEKRNVYASRSTAEFFGYSAEQMASLGDRLLPTIIHPEDIGFAADHHAQMSDVADGVTVEIEYRVRDAAGNWRSLHSWETVLARDPDGRPSRMLGIAQDVTSRVQTELALRESRRSLAESEQRWRSIVENPFDFVVVIDRAYKFTFVNFPAPGIKAEDLIGKASPLDFIAPADLERVRAALDIVFNEGRATSYEAYVPHLDQWFSSLVGPIRQGDQVTHASILTREIGAERRSRAQAERAEEQLRMMEAKLQQSAKLEAVGQLAGGIAHDFNNLLTGISGVAEVLAQRFHPSDPALRDVNDLRQAVERGSGLTRQLLAFSRQQPVAPTVLELNAVIDDTTRLLRRLIGEDIELVVTPTRQPLHARCDRSQFEQVLMNLAVNARDAMPRGGRLSLELASIEIDEGALSEYPDAHPGRFIRLTVSDNGSGMEPAVLARIFEPFFTTKAIGSGTGLGLSMVYGIVRQSGGFLQVRSEPERGTSFQIHLPRVAGENAAGATAATKPGGGKETVLLVEDDDIVLRFTRRLLEALGYSVRLASRGDAALAMIEAGLPFDVLLTDILLPGMDGHQLSLRAVAMRPGLPVVFMSGYTGNLIEERGVLEAGAAFLQKPFTHAALAEKIRSALDARKRLSERA